MLGCRKDVSVGEGNNDEKNTIVSMGEEAASLAMGRYKARMASLMEDTV